MLRIKFEANWSSGSGEDFLRFLPLWAWRPSLSCDLDEIYKLSFPLCLEAAYDI